jgi:hypothetical protein
VKNGSVLVLTDAPCRHLRLAAVIGETAVQEFADLTFQNPEDFREMRSTGTLCCHDRGRIAFDKATGP